MARPLANPGRVIWAGDHLLMNLRTPGASEDGTVISCFRTVYSPAGSGHAALALCDVGGDGWGPEDVRAIYTDNEEMTAWVRERVVRRRDHPFNDAALPVRKAVFEAAGEVGGEYRLTLRSEGREVVVTWAGFEAPLHAEGPGAHPLVALREEDVARGAQTGRFGDGYDIFTVLCPAQSGWVAVDGRRAAGDPYPREVWRRSMGRPLSSALIAVCEVLVE